jgi:hypothetical protein
MRRLIRSRTEILATKGRTCEGDNSVLGFCPPFCPRRQCSQSGCQTLDNVEYAEGDVVAG